MKALHDLLLPAPLRAAIQAVRNRLTAECSKAHESLRAAHRELAADAYTFAINRACYALFGLQEPPE